MQIYINHDLIQTALRRSPVTFHAAKTQSLLAPFDHVTVAACCVGALRSTGLGAPARVKHAPDLPSEGPRGPLPSRAGGRRPLNLYLRWVQRECYENSSCFFNRMLAIFFSYLKSHY